MKLTFLSICSLTQDTTNVNRCDYYYYSLFILIYPQSLSWYKIYNWLDHQVNFHLFLPALIFLLYLDVVINKKPHQMTSKKNKRRLQNLVGNRKHRRSKLRSVYLNQYRLENRSSQLVKKEWTKISDFFSFQWFGKSYYVHSN